MSDAYIEPPLIGVLKLYTRLIIAVLFHRTKDINNIPIDK